jgi:hypothetical protein
VENPRDLEPGPAIGIYVGAGKNCKCGPYIMGIRTHFPADGREVEKCRAHIQGLLTRGLSLRELDAPVVDILLQENNKKIQRNVHITKKFGRLIGKEPSSMMTNSKGLR